MHSSPRPPVRSREERDELVLKNSKLACFMANRLYKRFSFVRRMGLEDVVQIGYLKLIRAAELWDGKRCRFSTYACRAIQTGIYGEALRKERKASFISNTVDDDFQELDVPDREASDPLLCQEVYRVWEKLPEKYRYIVWEKLIEKRTFLQLAEKLKISRETVRKKYLQAKVWMRRTMDGEKPQDLFCED